MLFKVVCWRRQKSTSSKIRTQTSHMIEVYQHRTHLHIIVPLRLLGHRSSCQGTVRGTTFYTCRNVFIKKQTNQKAKTTVILKHWCTFFQTSNSVHLTWFVIEGPDPGGVGHEHMAQLLFVSKIKYRSK